VRLYEISFEHHTERHVTPGMKGWVVADNDLQVLRGIDGEWGAVVWMDLIGEEAGGDGVHAAGFTLVSLLRHRGEIRNPDFPVSDHYYGCMQYGWSAGVDIVGGEDVATVIRLGVAVDWTGIDISPLIEVAWAAAAQISDALSILDGVMQP
jgi:hypothetical protein